MEKNLIFDVGLHQGEDTDFYLRKGFRVVAIEAHPDLIKKAESRFSDAIAQGQLKIVDRAVCETDGPIQFYVNDTVSVWGTIRVKWKERNEKLGAPSRAITVQGEQFSNILKQYGVPYYLKCDIEGADMLCLRALNDFPERPQYVSIESELESWPALVEELETFRKLGYSKFKIIDQKTIISQSLPHPPREGIFVDHCFPKGASGPFGEESPGEWLSEQEALKEFAKIYKRSKWFKHDGILRRHSFIRMLLNLPVIRRLTDVSWYDTHAKL